MINVSLYFVLQILTNTFYFLAEYQFQEMVMAQPSPKCVGREFVRQYYTVLNMAPLCLYR